MTDPMPQFSEPSERDYAIALKALFACMIRFGPGPAIQTIESFERRKASIEKLKRDFNL